MTALLDAPVALLGHSSPRVLWTPPGRVLSLGLDCARWAEDKLGVELYPSEQQSLDLILAKKASGKWVAFEVADIEPRRNAKSHKLMVRMLFGLFELHERRIVYSAHLGDTSMEMYGDVLDVLERAPGLEGLVARTPATNGKEGVELKDGCKLRFKTRTRTGGRGLAGDVVVLDEAQELQDDQIQALSPILGSNELVGNPQLFYAGSAGTYISTVLARVRRRGINGGDPRLLLIEHSIDDEAWQDADPDTRILMAENPQLWAQANALLGRRFSEEWLAGQLRMLGPIGFAREHLGVGTWPIDDSTDWIVPRAKWATLAEPESLPAVGTVSLAIGAAWDRTVSLATCGARADGMAYAELTHYGQDSAAKIVAEVVRLRDAHKPCAIPIDDKGPADFLIAPLEAAGVVLEKLSTRDVAAATSGLHAAVTETNPTFRHRGQPEVSASLAGARWKDLGDGKVLDRRRSTSDVTPFEVLALARWGFVKFGGADTGAAFNIW